MTKIPLNGKAVAERVPRNTILIYWIRNQANQEKPTMDVFVTSTQKVFYQIPSEIAALLCNALPSVFQRYEKPAPPPVEPSWNVAKLLSGKLVLQYQHGAFTSWFRSSPGRICEWEKTLPADAGKCPESVRAEYAAKYVAESV